ncbi:MAG: threonine synthase [Deltaproteobacteria bacterium]|nr:threonine synthase [Deltaproteobacteria bacterium]
MRFYSTRDPGRKTAVDLKTALLTGLAPDGGLYQPEHVPTISVGRQATWRAHACFADLAAEALGAWFGDDVEGAVLRRIAAQAYDFPVPCVELARGAWVLDLTHGPSQSFKDFAAQFLLRLLDHLLARDGEDALLLTATSGDTGGAVASACHGRARIRAVILYPKGKISALQERQIAASPAGGENVTAIAVEGTFDDCQRLVKELLYDPALRGRRVTSANSINVGRLLPQTCYYWWAAFRAAQHGRPATFAVPSGNFGNLTAGVLAQRMGAPIAHFVAATNVNDAVPRYLATGQYAPQPIHHTISNAMDVGNPSNWERLSQLFGEDLAQMRRQLTGFVVDDAATRQTMRQAYARYQYQFDPHGAVAWHALEQFRASVGPNGTLPLCVALATAHPAKFPEIVQDATGIAPAVPAGLAACLHRPLAALTAAPTAAAIRALLPG